MDHSDEICSTQKHAFHDHFGSGFKVPWGAVGLCTHAAAAEGMQGCPRLQIGLQILDKLVQAGSALAFIDVFLACKLQLALAGAALFLLKDNIINLTVEMGLQHSWQTWPSREGIYFQWFAVGLQAALLSKRP